MKITDEYKIALDIFESLRRDFSELTMEITRRPENVDLEMFIPAQTGMEFPIELNLQNNDELHVVADVFWCEWFPCTDPEIAADYAAAVAGIISGRNRIEVHKRRGRAVKAILQESQEDKWEPLATWGTMYLPLGKRSIEYVQNRRNA